MNWVSKIEVCGGSRVIFGGEILEMKFLWEMKLDIEVRK